MGWVRRADPADQHECATPVRGSFGTPAGQLGDLWRCDGCGLLWRVADRCDVCDRYGVARAATIRHLCQTRETWRPASWWQRLRHWRRP